VQHKKKDKKKGRTTKKKEPKSVGEQGKKKKVGAGALQRSGEKGEKESEHTQK